MHGKCLNQEIQTNMGHLDELSTVNLTDDITGIFLYTNTVTDGLFTPMMVFAFFMVIMLGSFFSMKRIEGKGDLLASFTVAAFLSTGLSVIMLMRAGLINPAVPLLTIALTIAGIAGMYLVPKVDN